MQLRKQFRVGTIFESDTYYYADQARYDIYPQDAKPVLTCWYTLFTEHDEPILTAFVMRDLHDVTVDLGGAKLVFHGRVQPFALLGCRNITLKNFSIDYERPFYTQGTVTESAQGTFTIRIPEMFRYRVEDGSIIAVGENWERNLNYGAPLFQAYDAKTTRLSAHTPMMLAVTGKDTDPQKNPPCPIYELLCEEVAEQTVRFTGVPDFFRPDVGEIVAFTHENRHKNGFHLEMCEDTVLENIRLLHISSMALMADLCHNLTFRNFSCFADAETEGRIITVNADVLHGFNCTGRVLVENCRFENMLDDAFNFHSNYFVCEKQVDDHTFSVRGNGAGLGEIPMYLPGDTVWLYKGSTQDFKCAYTVEKAEYDPEDRKRMFVTMREEIGDFKAGDLLEGRRMPEIIIRNCKAGHARGGYRISTCKKVVMEDCVFENTPIMFTGDTNYWFENTGVRDVTIRDSLFEYYPGSCPVSCTPVFTVTDSTKYYHRGIKILNNRFIDCRRGLLYMRNTADVLFRGNTCLPGTEKCDWGMHFDGCAGIDIEE